MRRGSNEVFSFARTGYTNAGTVDQRSRLVGRWDGQRRAVRVRDHLVGGGMEFRANSFSITG
ncbi:hypothetical protein ACFPM7_29045 [Actinokineospora guangxiensis]|uniref:Uncharacterized protein n=1 Tax=Actinokineospora guangxiensis TaxID=1490288 RepID=A0ABW0EUY0_9PSEU